jgi:CheY-like chemotaxis protein
LPGLNTQLQGLGYKTLSAANGVEALAIVDSGAAFDLLFTDIIMPGGLNGRQLAAEVTARRPSLRVLFTSGYTENAIIHHGRLDLGVLLLAKPYRKLDLARMLRVALTPAGVLPAAKPPAETPGCPPDTGLWTRASGHGPWRKRGASPVAPRMFI